MANGSHNFKITQLKKNLIFIFCIVFKHIQLTMTTEELNNQSDGDSCYGHKKLNIQEYTMSCGSSLWWNYVVQFNGDGEQQCVFIENKDGWHLQEQKKLFTDLSTHSRLKLCHIHEEPEGWEPLTTLNDDSCDHECQEGQMCWTCGEPSIHKTWRDSLDEYEYTCQKCHRNEYPEEYKHDAWLGPQNPISLERNNV